MRYQSWPRLVEVDYDRKREPGSWNSLDCLDGLCTLSNCCRNCQYSALSHYTIHIVLARLPSSDTQARDTGGSFCEVAIMVKCPVCEKEIPINSINKHLDRGCEDDPADAPPSTASAGAGGTTPVKPMAKIFQTPVKRTAAQSQLDVCASSMYTNGKNTNSSPLLKRGGGGGGGGGGGIGEKMDIPSISSDINLDSSIVISDELEAPVPKRQKKSSERLQDAMPLAEKVRPKILEDICGQDLVGPNGVLRGLIEREKVPSMILWGSAGCGKTTIARVIAQWTKCRFVEISATDSGVGECKRVFGEAKSELLLTGRKTILFCDEIHRFSKSQQDVFLAPVESGQITL